MAIKILSKNIYEMQLNNLINNNIENIEYSYQKNTLQNEVEITDHIVIKAYDFDNNTNQWVYVGNKQEVNGKYAKDDTNAIYKNILDFHINKQKWFFDNTSYKIFSSYLRCNITYSIQKLVGGSTQEVIETVTRVQPSHLAVDNNYPTAKDKENIISYPVAQNTLGGGAGTVSELPNGAVVLTLDFVVVGSALDTEIVNTKLEERIYKKASYSLKENDFITNATKIDREISQKALASKIVYNWNNGKETAELLCQIGEYYDTNNNLVISTKDNTKPMAFNLGNIVIPHIYNSQGQDVPMSLNTDGTAKEFRVTGVDFIYDGAVWQKLTLQEL